jgi:hypothetical protein
VSNSPSQEEEEEEEKEAGGYTSLSTLMFLKTRLLLGSVMMSYTPSGGKATEKRA